MPDVNMDTACDQEMRDLETYVARDACPTCGGDGLLASSPPGYWWRCPTCHGEGDVEIAPATEEAAGA